MYMLHSMDSMLPSEIRLTRLHAGHTAVTHGMIRSSSDSTVVFMVSVPVINMDEYVARSMSETFAQ